MATRILSAATDLKLSPAEKAQNAMAKAIARVLASAPDAAFVNEAMRYASAVVGTIQQTGDHAGKRFACKGLEIDQPNHEPLTLANAYVAIVSGKRIPTVA
jgi:hypothetical protein